MKRVLAVLIVVLSAASPAASETKIGPKGQVIVDGKPVIPMAVWMQPPYLYEYHSQLGMNCMVGSHTERGEFRDQGPTIFPSAEKHGMGLVTQFRDSAVKEKTVWGWLGPTFEPGNQNDVRRYRERVRSKDPSRFTMSNLAIHGFLAGRQDDAYYTEVFKHTDSIISHVWPEVERDRPNIRNVALMIDHVRELCEDRPGGEVSIWPDINPHPWSNKKKRNVEPYPSPTQEELRFQIWLALIHGADAICIFPISFDPFVYSQIPAKNEQELAWNTRLVEKMTPALTADESPLAIAVTSNREDGVLDMTTRTLDGKHYVFLVNGQREEQTVTLRAPGLGGEWRLRDAVAGKAIDAKGGAFSEKLSGLALRIWELVPAKAAAAAGENTPAAAVAPVTATPG